jgi:glycosyl transferase family 25
MMLENIYYINLEHRKDRKTQFENEMKIIGWNNYTRFNAIKLKNGRVGCSMSHLKLLKMAKEKELEYIVILEDDIKFTKPKMFNQMLNYFFDKCIDYDVLLLAGNIRQPIQKIDKFIYRVQKSFTTTGYIVKKHYYDTLIHNIQEGINLLLKYPNIHQKYAIDTYWLGLQQKDKWYIFIPRTITQQPDYSDIETRVVNYNRLMLDI